MAHKGHTWPVWDVQFGPYGHYFVSCGQDRLARLWVTDHHQAVRVFAGNFANYFSSVRFIKRVNACMKRER